ncbi:MAG: hypothetical protein WBL15_00370 [Phycisphaerae bacterium]|nr:hypothetical protein [Phycisphaerae bacterium]
MRVLDSEKGRGARDEGRGTEGGCALPSAGSASPVGVPGRVPFDPQPAIRTSQVARPLLTWTLVLLVALLPMTEARAQTIRPAIASRRIVKHFDFNERPLGNYETTPMYWQRHSGPGFSLYLEGQFDTDVYHSAAPSFRLDLNGGSVAYDYLGGDIAVHPRCDYLITAWIRTAGLETARAYVTACYLDRKKNPIAGTEVRSTPLGGASQKEDSAWRPVSIGLAGNVPEARYIGLAIWLCQERVWNTAPRPPHAIDFEDVAGSAWFDDITVYRLPRVELTTSDDGPAFAHNADPVLLAEVRDSDGLGLSAKLTVRSADGVIVDERPVPLQPLDSPTPHEETYQGLPTGLYHAELVVVTDDLPLMRRTLSFLRLPETAGPPSTAGRGFGITLREADAQAMKSQVQLLTRLGVEYVKVPTWNPSSATMEASARNGVQQYLQAIARAHMQPIALLTDGPARSPSGTHPLLDILSKPAEAWRPLIAGDWSRLAGLVHVWQVGQDHDAALGRDERVEGLAATLRAEMGRLISDPRVATVTCVGDLDGPERRADFTSLLLPARVPVDTINEHLKTLLGDSPRRAWVTVETPTIDAYSAEMRFADLARRLVEAAWQQPGGVFLSAPWKLRREANAVRTDMSEDYLVFRTVADLLGEARPISRFNLDGHARCLLFDRNGKCVMLAWDPEAPPEGREYILPLGEEVRHLDLMGRPIRVGRAGQQRVLRLTASPTFIINAPTWPIEFRRHFALEPGIVEAHIEPREHQVVFRNTWPHTITGMLRLTGPHGWEIRPSRIPFALQPGEEFRQTVSFRLPIHSPADLTPLLGEFELDADRRYKFTVPAWFEVGLEGMKLDTFAHRADGRLLIRLMATNRTRKPMRFEAHLLAPGRGRAGGLFTTFLPNQPVTKIFALERPEELSGQPIRLTLKDLEGSRFWNCVLTVP